MNIKSNTIKLPAIVVLFIFLTFLGGPTHAQQEPQTKSPSLFLGLGMSINDYGYGGGIEIPVSEKISFYGNTGIGGWGRKLGAGISFYPFNVPYGSALSIGYASASGPKDDQMKLAVEPVGYEHVTIDFNRVGTINLQYSYSIQFGKKSKIVTSMGYAIPVTKNAYELKTNGVILTNLSKLYLDILRPGGLILGIIYHFGIK